MKIRLYSVVFFLSAVLLFGASPVQALTLIGAGDIGSCDSAGDPLASAVAVGALLDDYPGALIFTTGDNAYPDGTREEFADCFHPTWGVSAATGESRMDRLFPSPGNHDYHTSGADPYFDYFRPQLSRSDLPGNGMKGWYRISGSGWDIYSLNSNRSQIGSDWAEQVAWFTAELERTGAADCAMVYLHHPPYTQGVHSSDADSQQLLRIFYEHGGELFVAGHDHNYQRFHPVNPDGIRDDERGVRSFVVGTGGTRLRSEDPRPMDIAAVFDKESHGLLKLELNPGTYAWEFVPIPGDALSDSGAGTCHTGSAIAPSAPTSPAGESRPEGCYCLVPSNEQKQRVAVDGAPACTETIVRGPVLYTECEWVRGEQIAIDAAGSLQGATLSRSVTQRFVGLNRIFGTGGNTSVESISVISGRLIFFFLSVIGTVGLAMFIYAGLLFMFSQGNSQKEQLAFSIMVWTAIGLLALLGSYGIVSFVFDAFGA